MWHAWKSKLEEYEKWLLEPRNRSAMRFWDFLRAQFVMETPAYFLSNRKICLDVGCGLGKKLRAIVRNKLYSGIGLDPISSELQFFKLKKENLPIELVRGVGENLPIRNGSIDLVTIAGTLDHVENPEKVLEETHRVLHKAGALMVLQGTVTRKGFHDRTHLREFDEFDLRKMLVKKNFVVVKERLLHQIYYPRLSFLRTIIEDGLMTYTPRLYDLLGRMMQRLLQYPRTMIILLTPAG